MTYPSEPANETQARLRQEQDKIEAAVRSLCGLSPETAVALTLIAVLEGLPVGIADGLGLVGDAVTVTEAIVVERLHAHVETAVSDEISRRRETGGES